MYASAKSADRRRVSPVVWVVGAIVVLLIALAGWDGVKLSVIGIASFAVYFLPTAVAVRREHPQKNAIGVLNFALGWTLIGWVGALVWAFVETK